jgi:branched-chain amino acid transport system substrate-binding protein
MKLRNLSGVVLAGLLVVAACQPGASPAPGTLPPDGSPPAGSPPAGSPPPGGGVPEDPLRVVTIGPGEPLRIAMWGVLTGSDAPLGIDVQRGVELAVEDRPEIAGHTVELISEDAGCTPEGGNTAATRLASDTTLVGLIGSVCSDETVGGIEALTNAGLTTISPSNTRPALTAEDRGPEFAGYLRTAHNDEFQGAAAAEFVFNELGLTKAATIHDNSSYAQALQEVFAAEFQTLGGEITIQTAVGGGDENMAPVLTNVAATDPEIIYYPVFTSPFGFITAQARDIPGLEDVVLMGADAGFSADAIAAGGENALGVFLSSPDTRQFETGYPEFLEKFRAKYGGNPEQIFHAHAYDAANMLFDAIEEVAVQDGDTVHVPLGALRDRVFATSGHQGLTGELTCGETGDCGAPLIGVYEITQDIVDDPQGNWPPEAIWPAL